MIIGFEHFHLTLKYRNWFEVALEWTFLPILRKVPRIVALYLASHHYKMCFLKKVEINFTWKGIRKFTYIAPNPQKKKHFLYNRGNVYCVLLWLGDSRDFNCSIDAFRATDRELFIQIFEVRFKRMKLEKNHQQQEKQLAYFIVLEVTMNLS